MNERKAQGEDVDISQLIEPDVGHSPRQISNAQAEATVSAHAKAALSRDPVPVTNEPGYDSEPSPMVAASLDSEMIFDDMPLDD